jgi:hypothetical protein
MKIRTGFVSNSSSSSFVLFVSKEHYEEVKKNSDALDVEIIEHMKDEDSQTLFGKELIVFTDFCDMGGNNRLDDFTTENEIDSDNFWDIVHERWYEIQNRLTKKDESVSITIDY